MKNLVKVLNVMFFALSLGMLAACGDDEKPANRITVDGEGYKFSNAYVISQPTTNDDDEDGFVHIVYLTGDGLTIDVEEEQFDGDGNVAIIYLLSEDDEIEAGTYTLKTQEDADFGEAGTFVLATSFNGTAFDDAFAATSGKVKVSKSGSKYTFKLDFDEYKLGTDDEAEVGEGSIKGYFNGKVEVINTDDDTAKVREWTNPFAL